jgi:hypothetical protein
MFAISTNRAARTTDPLGTTHTVGTNDDNVRLALLNYGSRNGYRVLTADEVSDCLSGFNRDEVKKCLDQLANEELLTRFAGRYCFNKEIPFHVRHAARRCKAASDDRAFGRVTD